MILGVTGSRRVRPDRIVQKLKDFMRDSQVTELHHGDCTGWDEQAYWAARALQIKTVAHPPLSNEWRAFTSSDVVLEPMPYLDRNKDIVSACDFLIAAPDGPERQRSGTWSTVRHAKRVGVRGVVWVSGAVE